MPSAMLGMQISNMTEGPFPFERIPVAPFLIPVALTGCLMLVPNSYRLFESQ